MAMTRSRKLRTCLWFEKDGLAAARFYTGLVPDSALETDAPEGSNPIIVAFSLGGVPYQILNGGSHHRLTPAASIVISTRDQSETDHFWQALTTDGGAPSRCGWLTDRWGLSWQIVPEALPRLLSAPDRAAAGRVQAAMLQMGKIDIVNRPGFTGG
jgi:predicted 3-demethylubiquinone-9 3-methyltransferase (glyoxalase superfamily)